jgi:hypothetical protein
MRSVCRYGNITEYGIYVVPVTKFVTTARNFVGKKLRENPDAIAIVVVVVVVVVVCVCVCVSERERERDENRAFPATVDILQNKTKEIPKSADIQQRFVEHEQINY